MAWITKNSGTMPIERREEPYLNDAIKQHFEEEYIPRYPNRQAATIPLLHAIQDEHNWLPFQAIEEAADFLGLPASTVLDTATFYEEFFLQPRGKYTIWVCQSISCEIMGNVQLVDRLSQVLGISPGETTDDGRFTLMHVECIGACGGAPCALVNHQLHENLTVDNVEQIIQGLE
ncbi:MAG: NADH-quinone oxidoreductase subunit NuoE [Planctomycetota bacterium]